MSDAELQGAGAIQGLVTVSVLSCVGVIWLDRDLVHWGLLCVAILAGRKVDWIGKRLHRRIGVQIVTAGLGVLAPFLFTGIAFVITAALEGSAPRPGPFVVSRVHALPLVASIWGLALIEETIHRGVNLGLLRRALGGGRAASIAAIFVSTTVFVLFHEVDSLWRAVVLLLIGLGSAFVYVVCDTGVLGCTLFHGAYNVTCWIAGLVMADRPVVAPF